MNYAEQYNNYLNQARKEMESEFYTSKAQMKRVNDKLNRAYKAAPAERMTALKRLAEMEAEDED